MYALKQEPEDFIVKEISNVELKESGDYLIYLLKKRDYTTMRAIEYIANSLKIKPKHIGFAGAKDKKAVTEQYISIKGVSRGRIDSLKLKDISLEFKGYSGKPISLGDLTGNEFIITVRNLSDKVNLKKINKKVIMPNLFGEQRFSKKNVEIGRNLVKNDFKEAVKVILETEPDCKDGMEKVLNRSVNDFIGALQLIPKKLLLMYVHAYQSFIFNEILNQYIELLDSKNPKGLEKSEIFQNKNKRTIKNIKLPLIGFGTEIEDKEINKIIEEIMKKEDLTFRSFINRQMPILSLEGGLRDAFVEINDFKIIEEGKDFVKVFFGLKKGSYATVGVKYLLQV